MVPDAKLHLQGSKKSSSKTKYGGSQNTKLTAGRGSRVCGNGTKQRGKWRFRAVRFLYSKVVLTLNKLQYIKEVSILQFLGKYSKTKIIKTNQDKLEENNRKSTR